MFTGSAGIRPASLVLLILLMLSLFVCPALAASDLEDNDLPDISEDLMNKADIGLSMAKYTVQPWLETGTRVVSFYGDPGEKTHKLWIHLISNEPDLIGEEYLQKKEFLFNRAPQEGDFRHFNEETEYGNKMYSGYLIPEAPVSAHYLRMLSDRTMALVQLEYWGDDAMGDPDGSALRIFEDACRFVDSLAGTETVLEGTVTSVDGRPLSGVRVLRYAMEPEPWLLEETFTDRAGYFRFSLEELPPEGSRECIQVSLEHIRDGQFKYRILLGERPVYLQKEYEVNGEEDLTQNISLKEAAGGAGPYRTSLNRPDDLRHFDAIYLHMLEGWDFFTAQGWSLDYRLPVNVHAFRGSSTYYTPVTGDIVLARADSHLDSPHRPMNREWHELSHHAMFTRYGRWPEPHPEAINHGGYANPDTSDSLMEGFAEFMASAIGDYHGYPDPHLYRPVFNQESNYAVWHWRGLAEELAVSSLLWDLYDPVGDDPLDLSLGDILLLFGDYLGNAGELYDRAMSAFPSRSEDIRQVFALHGFFADREAGNGQYDLFEPYLDRNENRRRDPDEPFVDMGRPFPVLNSSDPVGRAASWQRPERSNTVTVDGLYLFTTSDAARYRFILESPGYPREEMLTEASGGRIPLPVFLPGAEFTLQVEVDGGITGKPLVLSSVELEERIRNPVSADALLEHDFEPSGDYPRTGEELPGSDDEMPVEPYWEVPEFQAEEADYLYTYVAEVPGVLAGDRESGPDSSEKEAGTSTSGQGGGPLPVLALGLLGAFILGTVFLLWRRKSSGK